MLLWSVFQEGHSEATKQRKLVMDAGMQMQDRHRLTGFRHTYHAASRVR